MSDGEAVLALNGQRGPYEGALLSVNNLELGFLVHAVWEPAKHGDVIARVLFEKVKAACVKNGMTWVYGNPWDLRADEK